MPIDQKRFNGPEVSIPYSIYTNRNSKNTEPQKSLLEKREDGREFSELRKMCKILLLLIIHHVVNLNYSLC